jgi:hypothetical protein
MLSADTHQQCAVACPPNSVVRDDIALADFPHEAVSPSFAPTHPSGRTNETERCEQAESALELEWSAGRLRPQIQPIA